MKSKVSALFLCLLAAPLAAFASDQVIPAGSLVQCTVSEPKLSSKTTAIGDPVLCQLSHTEVYGRSQFPAGSYLVGRFEDYKDPGHFVGKGWMELKFDRMVIQPDTVIPLAAKVVYVPKYPVIKMAVSMARVIRFATSSNGRSRSCGPSISSICRAVARVPC